MATYTADEAARKSVNDLRPFVDRLHLPGPLPLAHFLTEVANGADVLKTVESYCRRPPRARSFKLNGSSGAGDVLIGLRPNGGTEPICDDALEAVP